MNTVLGYIALALTGLLATLLAGVVLLGVLWENHTPLHILGVRYVPAQQELQLDMMITASSPISAAWHSQVLVPSLGEPACARTGHGNYLPGRTTLRVSVPHLAACLAQENAILSLQYKPFLFDIVPLKPVSRVWTIEELTTP